MLIQILQHWNFKIVRGDESLQISQGILDVRVDHDKAARPIVELPSNVNESRGVEPGQRALSPNDENDQILLFPNFAQRCDASPRV